MKTFNVHVHYDMVYSCDVKARTQQEAEEKAESLASNAGLSELECVDTNICSYEI